MCVFDVPLGVCSSLITTYLKPTVLVGGHSVKFSAQDVSIQLQMKSLKLEQPGMVEVARAIILESDRASEIRRDPPSPEN